MKKLSVFLLSVFVMLSVGTKAQTVPNYVPAFGLVGWWPFNGNANDASGNGNNANPSGATLSTDRFGAANSSYSLDGVSNYISVSLSSIANTFPANSGVTTNIWVKTLDGNGPLAAFRGQCVYDFNIGTLSDVVQNANHYGLMVRDDQTCCGTGNNIFGSSVSDNQWHMVTVVRAVNGTISCFLDGVADGVSSPGQTGSLTFSSGLLAFGADLGWILSGSGCQSCNTVDQQHLNGQLDDIGVWNRALSPQEIQGLFIANSYSLPSYVPSNGLVGWWPFNGNASDESGNGHNGIVYGAQPVQDRNGNSNSAYTFDGSTTYISCLNPNYSLSNAITLSSWVRVTGAYTQGEQKILSKGTYNTLGHFNITYSNGANTSVFYGGFNYGVQNQAISTVQHLPNTGWDHVVVVYDGSSIKLFVNNQLEATKSYTGSIPSINDLVMFGKMLQPAPNDPPYYFKGDLDDIGIWNRALTPSEVSNLYYSCISQPVASASADGPTTICAGNYVYLTATSVLGATYQWKKNNVNIATNSTSVTFKASATGAYTCLVTNPCGATTTNAIAVVSKTNAAATITANGSTTFCAGDSVTLSATNLGSNYSVQWYRTNISMDGATNYSQVVKQPGTYKVVTKNSTTGCSRISASSIVVGVNCRIANPNAASVTTLRSELITNSLGDVPVDKQIHLFPNPNAGSFTVEYFEEIDGKADLQIMNTLGQTVYRSEVGSEEGLMQHKIDLGDNFQKGIYVIRLKFNGEIHESKVLLQ